MDYTSIILSGICLVSIIATLICLFALNHKLDTKINDSDFYKERLDTIRTSRYARQKKVDKQIDRLKLALFFALNEDDTRAINILSGRTSHDAIIKDMSEIRKALVKEGTIDSLWVVAETDNTENLLYED